MSLETGDIDEGKCSLAAGDTSKGLDLPGTLVDLSGAEKSSDSANVLEPLGFEEPVEHDKEFTVQITKADLARPDTSMDETKAGSPSTKLAVESERFETRTAEESEMEFEAAVTKSIFDLLRGDGAGSPSDKVTALEHLENGDCKEPKMEKPANEASSVDLNLPDSLIDNNADGNSSDVAIIDSPMVCSEKATNGDFLEELVVDTGLDSGSELMQLPLDEDSQVVSKEVQDIPENDFESEYPVGGSKHHLPLEAGKNVIQLQCESSAPGAPNGLCTVNIVGTAHVSKASCEEVKALIRHVNPEVVFLELCSSRTNILVPRDLEVPSLSSMLAAYRKKEMNLFGLMYSWFLAKAGEKLEIHPGTEFRIAYEEAVKCGASVTLGDRPIQVTLKRTWGMMSTWHKIKLLFGLLTASFNLPSADEFQALMEKMEQSDELTLMIQELSKTFPSLSETLVVERDLYMVASLHAVARRYSSIVAVVGRGHLFGIAKHWKEDINVKELMTIPTKNSSYRKWWWSSLALGVGGIVVGVHLFRHK